MKPRFGFMHKLWPIRFALTAMLSLLATPALRAEPNETFLWQSEKQTLEELSKDVTSLYIALEKAGLLPLREYIDREGRTLQEVMRSNDLIFGKSFPLQLDLLLCKINSSVCKVTEHLTNNKTVIKRSQWANRPGSSLILPDIRFTKYDSPQSYDLKRGQDLKDITVRIRKGCETFDQECRDAVLNLNKGNTHILSGEYEGRVTIPTLSLTTSIEMHTKDKLSEGHEATHFPAPPERNLLIPRLNHDLFGGIASSLSKVSPKQITSPGDGSIRADEIDTRTSANSHDLTELQRAPASALSDNVAQLQKDLAANLVTGFGITLHSEVYNSNIPANEPKYSEQAKLFDAVRHPFAVGRDLPENKSIVAVLDSWVETSHCDFANGDSGGQIYFGNISNRETTQPVKADTGFASIPPEPHQIEAIPRALSLCDGVDKAIPERDHGTHVAGVIGAHLNGKGMVGVNPNADIHTYEVSPSKILTDQEAFRLAQTLYTATKLHGIDVYNLSWEYPPPRRKRDPIQEQIRKLSNGLFVTSAGNDGADKTAECNVFPACLDIENVLAVVALGSDSEDIWNDESGRIGSNYGRRFHIAAPGADILGPISGGYFGKLSGTSQSAAIVTGAASLLFSVDRKLRPRAVKQRLIYTSDLTAKLSTKLLGGKLNIDRALDFSNDLIELKSNRSFKGAIRGKNFIVYMDNSVGPLNERFQNILRISCGDPWCTLMLRDDSTATVKKIEQAIVLRRGLKIRMNVVKDSDDPSCSTQKPCLRTFLPSDIHDYTSALQ